MADKMDKQVEKQLKDIWKAIADIQKRLKFVEERGKVLADSLTSSKDIDKLIDVHVRKMERSRSEDMKATERRFELSDKLVAAQEKESEKGFERQRKEAERITRDAIKDIEKQKLDARLTALEARVASMGR